MESQLGISMELIVEARSDPALISSAVVLSAAALGLIVFKAPGGIFLRLHGSTPAYFYYGVLSAVVIFGRGVFRLLGGAVHVMWTAGTPPARRCCGFP